MSWPWDHAFVINLVKRPDRLLAFRKQSNAMGMSVRTLRAHEDKRVPQTGCMASHASLLRVAGEMGGMTAIFEDDAVFPEDFYARLERFVANVPVHWEVLWLGGRNQRVARAIADGVVAPTLAHRSQAYIVRDAGVAQLLAANARSHLQDGTHFDHVTADFMAATLMRVYAPNPWLVGQAAGKSDITGGHARERWS